MRGSTTETETNFLPVFLQTPNANHRASRHRGIRLRAAGASKIAVLVASETKWNWPGERQWPSRGGNLLSTIM